jgi:histidyl-tRNA synthetase
MIERLPGFRDFYPEPLPHPDVWSADARQHVFEAWRQCARRYGFREYDGPPLETLDLYTTKSGGEIVGQLYNFQDKGQREIALRPEMTPTLARMVAAHERAYKKPIKWFALPQLFRYERHQKGRLKEHFQFNADIIGETDPGADAEIIALLIDSLRALNLTEEDFVIRLSSRLAWQKFFAERNPNEAQAYEFYQAIDKLERDEAPVSRDKLSKVGIQLVDVQQFIATSEPTTELNAVLENLAARGLSEYVKIDYNIIRGLAYYTGVVFEAFDRKGTVPRAIAGGGRYDNLIKLMSGGKVDLPALGFGMGDVVLLEILRERKLLPQFTSGLDVFCLIEDEGLRPDSLQLIQTLRSAGYSVDYSFIPLKSDKQFKRALELSVELTCKVEKTEGGIPQIRLRVLKTREEHVVPVSDLTAWLAKTLPPKR